MHFLTLFDFRSSPGLSEEENGVCSVQCPCNTELIQGVQLAKARVASGGPSHPHHRHLPCFTKRDSTSTRVTLG